jgi:hypothetical protein
MKMVFVMKFSDNVCVILDLKEKVALLKHVYSIAMYRFKFNPNII